VEIIGQFGVGFYSAFMVAEQVTVISRAFGQEEGFSGRKEEGTARYAHCSEELHAS